MCTYHVWGIRRSGNHAVIGWILENRGSPYVHFNDIQDPRDPLTPGGVHVSGVPMWRYKRGVIRKVRYGIFARDRSMFAGSDPSLDYRGLAAVPGLACRVFSYEDKEPIEARAASSALTAQGVSKTILVLRDPFNLFASLLKAQCFSRRLDELPSVYQRHAEKFLRQEEIGVVGVNYNEWVRHAEVRMTIARKLGFQTDGSAYDHVPHNGGGSSILRTIVQRTGVADGCAWQMAPRGREPRLSPPRHHASGACGCHEDLSHAG